MAFSRVSSDNLFQKPYRNTVDLEIFFSDSTSYVEASGIVIGENDILTASHAVYQPGKTIQSIRIYAGRSDVSGSDQYLYSYTGQAQFDYNEVGDGSGTILFSQVGQDYAVIGITEPIGAILGTTAMSSTGYVGQTTKIIGYGTNIGVDVLGADISNTTTDINRTTNIIRYANDASPGNSGGPILQTINGQDVVIGVVSGAGGYGAFLDMETVTKINADMGSNDNLLNTVRTLQFGSSDDTLTGTASYDHLSGGAGNDRFISSSGNDLLDGGSGSDIVTYAAYKRADANVIIESDGTLVNVSGKTDRLNNIERITFSDGTLVLDVIEDQAASVYRLYRASFGRTPDEAGLSENVSALEDRGLSLKQLAAAFLGSAEFQQRYGVNVTTDAYVTLLYNNVLDRAPEAGGFAAWTTNLDAGAIDVTDALIGFSDSQENINAISSAISHDGIWLF